VTLAALSPQAIWREMRLHMEWNQGLALCFLFADSAPSLQPLREWADVAWQARTAPLLRIVPAQAATAAEDVLQGLQKQVMQLGMVRAPVWVEMLALDGPESSPWEAARARLLARLNESREWLVHSFARPLVLCLPPAWSRRVVDTAPDLWQVRAYSASVAPLLREDTSPPRDAGNGQMPQAGAANLPWADMPQAVQAARARLVAQPEQIGLRRELAVLLGTFAQDRVEQGRSIELAVPAARESLALFRDLQARLGDQLPLLRDLSVSLNNAGDVARALGQLEAARSAYAESLDIRRQLKALTGDTPQSLRDLSASLSKMGDVVRDLGQLDEARSAYAESLAIHRQLKALTGDTPQSLRDLSVSLERVGDVARVLGQLEEARSAYSESLAICRQLKALTGDTPQSLRDVSVSLNKVGNVAQDLGQLEKARSAYAESLTIHRQLKALTGDTPQSLRDLSVSLNKVGDVAQALGQVQAAQAAHRESLEIRRHLRTLQGDLPQVLDDLAVSLKRIGTAAPPASPERAAAWQEALALRQQLVAAHPDSAYHAQRLATLRRLIDENPALPDTLPPES